MDDSSTGITPGLSYKWASMFPICTDAPRAHVGRR